MRKKTDFPKCILAHDNTFANFCALYKKLENYDNDST